MLLIGAAGCVGPGMITDGTSVSVGTHSRGALRHGVTLPVRGDGYIIPQRWKDRGRNYGTDELVSLLVRSSRLVTRRHRGGLIGIADISLPGGGQTPEHRSHYSGRDVDFIFYSTDLQGKSLIPRQMVHYDAQGLSVIPASQPAAAQARDAAPTPPLEPVVQRRLDLARNWSMVRALVTDRQVPVQWIFVGRPVIRLLLAFARKRREPAFIIERAASVLHQPSDAQSHMDHGHLRVYCSVQDRRLGCVDRGPPRWFKKDIKYIDAPLRRPPLPPSLARLTLKNLLLRGL